MVRMPRGPSDHCAATTAKGPGSRRGLGGCLRTEAADGPQCPPETQRELSRSLIERRGWPERLPEAVSVRDRLAGGLERHMRFCLKQAEVDRET